MEIKELAGIIRENGIVVHDEWLFLLSVLYSNLTVTQDFPFVTSFFPYCITSIVNLQRKNRSDDCFH